MGRELHGKKINVETFMWLDLLFQVMFVLECWQIHSNHFFADTLDIKVLYIIKS